MIAKRIAADEGFSGVTARRVGAAAGVSPSGVSSLTGGITELIGYLIRQSLLPLLDAFSPQHESSKGPIGAIVTGPFARDPLLAPLVVNVASYFAVRSGERQRLGQFADSCWTIVQDHLVKAEVPSLDMKYGESRADAAARVIGMYFSAALHLSRNPRIELPRLIKLITD